MVVLFNPPETRNENLLWRRVRCRAVWCACVRLGLTAGVRISDGL